jgi:hypothetical protein
MIHRRAALIAFALLVVGCEGPAGPPGEQGEAGTAGQSGTQGVVGPTGPQGMTALEDGGVAIPVGCLSPCHGFNGVVAQFQTSAHYIAYVQNLGTAQATEWTTTGSPCGNCHAVDGLQERVTGSVLTTDDAGVVNLANGELQYAAPDSGALSTSNYAGSATVAEVYCTTCHLVTNADDPHVTGIPWTPGSFPLQIEADAGDIFIEKSPTTAAVTGTNAGNFASGDTCMWCHRSRVDITNYITPTGNKITSVFWGPHEGPQADLFTGVGGYHYKGQTYGESTHEQQLSCTDCHMIPLADNHNVADHSFNPNLLACAACHATATTFNVNGFQSEVQNALTQIETWFNTEGLLTRATAAPYVPLTAAEVGDGNFADDMPVPGGTIAGALLTQDQAGALYNYILVARGGASGVHNPKYIGQILYDSYNALTGLPLSVFPMRPE